LKRLPIDGFTHAVLLCERENGNITEDHLSKDFFSKFGTSMSQSKGQVKFNVVNSKANAFLKFWKKLQSQLL
jgi:hypothetical protein